MEQEGCDGKIKDCFVRNNSSLTSDKKKKEAASNPTLDVAEKT